MLLLTIEVTNLSSPSLPGNPLSLKVFKSWIADAEATPAISLTEARKKWADKRKQLQQLSKY